MEKLKTELKDVLTVRAFARGQCRNCLRNPGDIFLLTPYVTEKNGKEVVVTAEQQFHPKWMERVEG